MQQMFSLSGKTILVTGASSGIGREIAISAASMGASLVITGRDETRLQETKDLIGAAATMLVADLVDEAQLNHLVSKLPVLNGAVFCAGRVDYTPVKFINAAKLQQMFALNFNSQVLLSQQLIRQKKLAPATSLVYVSSIASKLGVAATALYASSKAALNAFVKVTAAELAPQKIRANAVCPGLVKTPLLSAAATGSLTEDTFEAAAKNYPLGLGEPIDVAAPVVFLLSDAARWITGTELIADGGHTIN